MDAQTTLLFITLCGILGLFLRRNFLNIIVSLIQILIGLIGLFGGNELAMGKQFFVIYMIFALFLVFVLFLYSVANLLIRRRSTLKSNEVAELRG